MPSPRNENDPEFHEIVDEIYRLMTTAPGEEHRRSARAAKPKSISLGSRLPDVEVSEITGLVEHWMKNIKANVICQNWPIDFILMSMILFQLTEILEILGFARVSQGDLEITLTGKELAEADILKKKEIFAAQTNEICSFSSSNSSCIRRTRWSSCVKINDF